MSKSLEIINVKLKDKNNKYDRQVINGKREILYIIKEDELGIIESELKAKEKQDNAIKVIKEVVAFAKVVPHIEPNKENGFDIMSAVSINIQRDIENRERKLLRQWVLETCFPKELKALEIIVKKRVNILCLLFDKVESYNSYIRLKQWKLSQKQFDLLKEVMKSYGSN